MKRISALFILLALVIPLLAMADQFDGGSSGFPSAASDFDEPADLSAPDPSACPPQSCTVPTITVPAPFFGMTANTLGGGHNPTVNFGIMRLWDTNCVWPLINTSNGVYTWTNCDAWFTQAQTL